ncbi:MAG: thioredoxin [Calditrichia bacterium]
MAGKNVIELTDANWEAEVINSDVPVVVDFWAVWCAPCRLIAPLIDELADEYVGKVKFGKLDVDNNQQTAIKYGIRSIPTLLFFKNGEAADTLIGAVPKDEIKNKVDSLL